MYARESGFFVKFLTNALVSHTFGSPSALVQKTYPKTVQESYADFKPVHEPVLLEESLEFMGLKKGDKVVDCTLGLGGHSSAILQAIGKEGFLYAFDKDERNIRVAQERLAKLGTNFKIFHDSFSSLTDRLRGEGASRVDAILFDLGLSSPHLDDPLRGFSFLQDGPLDMRFDASKGKTAADLLNKLPEKELAYIFWKYGEERASRKLARAVIEKRKEEPFARTGELKDLVETALGKGKPGKHRATQIFQALRIAVNEELMALELGLQQAVELLAPHGRVVVLSYHSLEDRIVKHLFKQLSTDLRDPNDPFGRRVQRPKSLSLLTKKPILPTEEEVKNNSRARSAKLRAAEKL
jgi:16S rRNA (cytosine1402-N4)-methyltransferase